MIIVGEKKEEIDQLAGQLGIPCRTALSLNSVKPGEPLWITPASYPEIHEFSSEELKRISELVEGGSRVLVEYDIPLPAISASASQCKFERLVVRQNDHPITSGMKPLDIFEAHQTYFQFMDFPLKDSHELLSIARVSGFDTAVYGLPEQTYPALTQLSASGEGSLLWSSTSISSPAYRRYKPVSRWTALLEQILLYLTDHERMAENPFPEDVLTNPPEGFCFSDENRKKLYKNAIDKNLTWYQRAEMLISGDGSQGVLEGLSSGIDIDGNQTCMLHEGKPNERGDCNVQSAFAFLCGGKVLGDDTYTNIGKNLLDFSIFNFQY